jgi:4-hydroxy-tetrahydrodipicolinate synthase
MSNFDHLAGVYAAVITPLDGEFNPDLNAIPRLLEFLAMQGCHGALILGTTGEGPSFAPEERISILKSAVQVRETVPDFHLLAGTGTPSLEETIYLTRKAFDYGVDGVVVLPPYYFRKVSDDGLFSWFYHVIHKALPTGGALFGYHIPAVSGVPLSLDLLEKLKTTFPDQFAGIKDSSGDPEHAMQIGQRFGDNFIAFTGHDSLLNLALQNHASGCITALANILSPLHRMVWDSYQRGQPDKATQERLAEARLVTDRYPPAPALLKALLALDYHFPNWTVRPPLIPPKPEAVNLARAELRAAINSIQAHG